MSWTVCIYKEVKLKEITICKTVLRYRGTCRLLKEIPFSLVTIMRQVKTLQLLHSLRMCCGFGVRF